MVAAAATAIAVGLQLPLTGGPPPSTRGVGGAERPAAAFDAAFASLTSRPTLVAAIVILAVAAATAGLARSRGLWAVAAWGAVFLGALLLVAGSRGRSSRRGLPGLSPRSGWRRARSRIRCSERLVRVAAGTMVPAI